MADSTLPNCPHCNAPLPAGALACPACNRLVFEARIGELLQNAQRLETVDPTFAAGLLRQAMTLVPPGSQPHQVLAARAAALSASAFGGPATASQPPLLNHPRPETPNDT